MSYPLQSAEEADSDRMSEVNLFTGIYEFSHDRRDSCAM